MSLTPIPPLDHPLIAVAVEGEVVLTSLCGHGRPVIVAMTPQAVMASVGPMSEAAAAATLQREEAERAAAVA
jgi:hypothetical protein